MDLQQLALQETALKALLDDVTKSLKEVKAQMQEALDTTGASGVAAKLPDGTKVGTIYRTDPKPAAVVVDEKALHDWIHANYPTEATKRAVVVIEVREAFKKGLLDQLTAIGAPVNPDTGEAVPGVEIRATRAAGHGVRGVDRDAIAKAWRNRELPDLNVLQLTAAPAEEAS